MVRGGCRMCGQRTTNNRLCNRCQKLRRHGFFVENREQKQDPSTVLYECVECGTEYEGTVSTPCPDCGETRCRAAKSEVATDGGQPEWVSEPETTWCSDCQRYRVSCAHLTGDSL
ncbi:hypothetical protein EA473_22320 [Natrarchaeobius chitinivorans]|uniref:Uncharacterized protein n=1 Tax=Natrarchaeobius chitinivorans TaxID=1679083 RepID=A0A3N6LQQ6_NATCH|nr:hypothetical protein EA473_22320 [Natrarchaeobius chitinivorans]